MTRFARAKGSKASNERIPEEATEWHVMQQQVLQSRNKKKVPASTNAEVDANPKPDTPKEKNIQWSDFPDVTPTKIKVKPSKQKKIKSVKGESLKDEATVKQSKEPVTTEATDCDVAMKVKKKKRKLKEAQSKEPVENEAADCEHDEQHVANKRKLEEDQTSETDGQGAAKKPKHFMKDDESEQFKNKKKFKGGDFKRRKPASTESFMGINGKIETMYFDRFPVKKEDGFRLIQLRKDLIKKGVPRSSIEMTMKLERRRAEKALAAEKRKVCFNCRQSGHNISDCPELRDGPNSEMTATGICFKCGSTQHISVQCKVTKGDSFQFATCFICKEVGHISRQCPDNSRGIYPRGGSCNMCGDVTHLKINCPQFQAEKQESTIFAEIQNDEVESLGNESKKIMKAPSPTKAKFVRF